METIMSQTGKELNGAEIFLESLRKEGVDTIFGYPGGAVLGIYDKLYDCDFIHHILVRHEQGAAHMAEGYAKATGKVGVVLVTSGPGATNTVTGIADAYMDSIPLVVFTGQVPSKLIGNDAFQEADIVGITRPITKHNFLVKDVEELASTIKKAFFIASTGRPGPVLIDMPKDMLAKTTRFVYPDQVDIKGYKPTISGHSQQIKKAAAAFRKAKRPLLYVGGGVVMAGAHRELGLLAQEAGIPVTMTLQGLGAFPMTDPLSLGMLGMHGTFWANMATENCDLLVSLGARFDDRVTGNTETFARNAYKIQVDIDPTAIDKNVRVDLPIVGDLKSVLADLLTELSEKPVQSDYSDWWTMIQQWKDACPLEYDNHDGKLRAQFVLQKISEKVKGQAVVVTDVGQHQMWATQWIQFDHPRSHITSGGLGTMGFSVPAAIGAAFAVTDRPVISISGDGGFQMNMQELITAAHHKLPVKFIILNNSFLGMVRQWQGLFYKEKFSFTDLSASNPDFVKVAEAFGCKGLSTDSPDEVDALLDAVLAYNEGPVLAEFKVVKEEMVFPMVPSGGSMRDIMVKRLDPNRLV